MHVNRLDGRQWAQVLRICEDDLAQHPGIYEAAVRIDQDSLASGFLAPAGNIRDFLQIFPPACTARDRACGKDINGAIYQGSFHYTQHELLAPRTATLRKPRFA